MRHNVYVYIFIMAAVSYAIRCLSSPFCTMSPM